MATIRKRGSSYQVEVRRKGYPRLTRTFATAAEAKAWARHTESEADRGELVDRTEVQRTTLGEALERYRVEVTEYKRSREQEEQRIRALLRHPLAQRSIASLRSLDFARYRDERLKKVGPATVRLELALISHLFSTARKEWGFPVDNPITHIRKPSLPPGRDRRFSPDEETKLLAACSAHSVWLHAIVCLAIATGMRAGEMCELTWQQVDLAKRCVLLGRTKNGSRRVVPLSLHATSVLQALPRQINGKVFPFEKSKDLSKIFSRVCKKAGIEDLHFHDLRHEAASRLAPHMPVQTLAKVMGWKTLNMAMRYYNPSHAELLAAVDAATAARA